MIHDTVPLTCTALTVIAVGYFILSKYLPKWAALLIAAIKVAVPFVYFAFYFQDAGWTLYDDVKYYDVAASLVHLGYSPWDVVIDPDGRDLLSSAAASRHTLYYTWNVVAQYIIGTQYYAAVFFNVGLTFVTGALLFHTLRLLSFPTRFLRGLLAFHMLHWDYLSWTSLINVKETLVEALVIASVYCIMRFIVRGSWISLLGVAMSFLLLFMLRLYIPFLVMSAIGLWILLQWRDPRKFVVFPIVIALLFSFYAKIGAYEYQLYPHLLAVGGFRFLLTPQPWSITSSYSFLQVPMILQWLFLGPAVVGAVQLWRQHRECRLLILVLLAFVAFYSIFPAHQGPRHRVQLVALFSVIEFQVLAGLFLRQPAGRQSSQLVTTGSTELCVGRDVAVATLCVGMEAKAARAVPGPSRR